MAQRIVRGAAATLEVYTWDAEGDLAAVSGTMTVGVVRADGTTVLAAGTATSSPSTGKYTVAVTAADTASLDRLTATWTNGTVTWTTFHEIVGAVYWSEAELRAWDSSITAGKYPSATVLARRQTTEQECEQITGRAFVPRFRVVEVDGSGSDELLAGLYDVRSIRRVAVYPSGDLTGSPTVLTAGQRAQVKAMPDGRLVWIGGVWTAGVGNVVVHAEVGWDAPPPDLVVATMIRARAWLNMPGNGLPDRAATYTSPTGESYELLLPSARRTGIAEVDAVYARWSVAPTDDDRPVGVSRVLSYNVQRDSLFHGR